MMEVRREVMAVVLAEAAAVLVMGVVPAGVAKTSAALPTHSYPSPPPVSTLLLLFYEEEVEVVTLLFLYLYNILVFVHVIGK